MNYQLVHEVTSDDCYIRDDYSDSVNIHQSFFDRNIYKRRKTVFVFCAGFASGILLSFIVGFIIETNIQHGKVCNEHSATFRKLMKSTTPNLQNISTTTMTTTLTSVSLVPTTDGVTTEYPIILTTTQGFDDIGYFEYVIMFLEPYSYSVTPTVFILSNETGSVDITNKTANTVLSGGLNTITFKRPVLMKDGIQNTALHIKSTVPIVVYGFDEHTDTSEGFLAIPAKHLSQKYVIPSFTVWKSRSLSKSLIGIAAIYKGTLVKIKIKTKSGSVKYIDRTYRNGDVIQISMSPFQSVQLSHNIDLSGSIVTSSHPVAVISGNKCNSITHAPCNHFSEMVLPENQLDNSYIVPIINARPKSTVRILCPTKASVDIKTDMGQFHADLNEGEFYDFKHSNISYITSTEGNVLVTMFPHELKASKGDSYMMTIIGQHQYKSEYHFVVPNGFTSSVSITVLGSNTEGFEIDGKRITSVQASTLTFQNQIYTTFSYSISSGAHNIRHMSGVRFGLWIYGSKWHDGYGYPAGIVYK